MKKEAGKQAGKTDTAPAKDTANAEGTADEEPEQPQNGFGKFEYIN